VSRALQTRSGGHALLKEDGAERSATARATNERARARARRLAAAAAAAAAAAGAHILPSLASRSAADDDLVDGLWFLTWWGVFGGQQGQRTSAESRSNGGGGGGGGSSSSNDVGWRTTARLTMNSSLTKKPMKPMIKKPTAVLTVICVNSVVL
jgi:membrane protein involved in colicin uptake